MSQSTSVTRLGDFWGNKFAYKSRQKWLVTFWVIFKKISVGKNWCSHNLGNFYKLLGFFCAPTSGHTAVDQNRWNVLSGSIISFMVMSIISACFCIPLLVCSSIGLGTAQSRRNHWPYYGETTNSSVIDQNPEDLISKFLMYLRKRQQKFKVDPPSVDSQNTEISKLWFANSVICKIWILRMRWFSNGIK